MTVDGPSAHRRRWEGIWRHVARLGPTSAWPLAALALIAIASLVSDPLSCHFELGSAEDGGPPRPSLSHPLGLDPLRRDVLSRLLVGSGTSLWVALLSTSLATAVGASFGMTAAAFHRYGLVRLERAMMASVELILAFPGLLLMTFIGVLVGGTSPLSTVLTLGLTGWVGIARVVRERSRAVLQQEFADASFLLGSTPLEIVLRHVWPHAMTTAASMGVSLASSMVLAEATLGYLSLGLPPPHPSLGRLLHEGETYILMRPLLVVAPAFVVVLFAFAFQRVGAALAEKDLRAPSGRPLIVLVLAFALWVFLPARPLEEPKTQAPPSEWGGTTFRLATSVAPKPLEPALASDQLSVELGALLFGRLLELNRDGSVGAGLTERMAWSDGGRTLTLTLRQGVRFHDGAELTAADVKRSLERALGPKVPSPSASLYSNLVGFEAYRGGAAPHFEGIRVVDRYTVRFDQSQVDSTLPSLLTLLPAVPVCPSMPSDPSATTSEDVCGAGPFRFGQESEGRMVLHRHDQYFESGLPKVDHVEVLFEVRPQAQRYRFERGELDMVRELTSSDLASFRRDPRWRSHLTSVDNLRVSAIFLNCETEPFKNPHLRRAVSLAVDPSVLEKIRPELVELRNVAPQVLSEAGVGRQRDLSAALTEMKLAGFAYDPEIDEGGYPEPVEYLTVPDSAEQQAAEAYQYQLSQIGFRVTLKLLPYQAYLAEVQSRGRTQMGWAGWQADFPDVVSFFDPVLTSHSIGPTSHNVAFYQSEELDGLLEEMKRTTDVAQRQQRYRAAEAVVLRDAPWIPTSTPKTVAVIQRWVADFEPSPLSQLDLRRVRILAP